MVKKIQETVVTIMLGAGSLALEISMSAATAPNLTLPTDKRPEWLRHDGATSYTPTAAQRSGVSVPLLGTLYRQLKFLDARNTSPS
jgi:hypothetical protein